MIFFFRMIGYAFLIYGAYLETGGFTAFIFVLLAVAAEADGLHRESVNRSQEATLKAIKRIRAILRSRGMVWTEEDGE